MRRRPLVRRRAQRGFSLLEVLVAFAVLAMSLGALYQSAGGSVRGMQKVEQRTSAVMQARSLLELYDTVPAGGVNLDGGGADGSQWRIVATPEPAEGENAWPMYRIEIEVWAPAATRAPTYRIATLRPEREPEKVDSQ